MGRRSHAHRQSPCSTRIRKAWMEKGRDTDFLSQMADTMKIAFQLFNIKFTQWSQRWRCRGPHSGWLAVSVVSKFATKFPMYGRFGVGLSFMCLTFLIDGFSLYSSELDTFPHLLQAEGGIASVSVRLVHRSSNQNCLGRFRPSELITGKLNP